MKVIIIGGVAGGATCATRLRRLSEDIDITIYEKSGYVSYANCGLPYYLGNVIKDKNKLTLQTPKSFKERFNVDVFVNHEVIKIDRLNKEVIVKDLINNKIFKDKYDKLVISTGAKAIIPNIEGRELGFSLKNVEDTFKIDDLINKNNIKNVVVVGAGFIGLEVCENLVRRGLNVYLVEMQDQVLSLIDKEMSCFIENELRKNNVILKLNKQIISLKEENGFIIAKLTDEEINCDMVVFSLGVKAETKLAKECGLKLGLKDGIVVDNKLLTSDKDIYACGDAIITTNLISGKDNLINLAGPANKQARIIADNIAGYKSVYKKTTGSAVVKVFDLTIACAGNSEEMLIKKNIPYWKTFTYGFSHANYYPGATRTMYKLLFNNEGDILGIQAAGREGVEKRVDVIATAIRSSLKVWDLIDSELCYAPPYSSAKDPVNILGMHADNILKGFVKPAYFEDIKDSILIDIRSQAEFENETIDGAINIFTPELRTKYTELPKDKKIVLFCNTGFQSYVASRILIQRGFNNVYSLTGGITLYNELVKNEKALHSQTANV